MFIVIERGDVISPGSGRSFGPVGSGLLNLFFKRITAQKLCCGNAIRRREAGGRKIAHRRAFSLEEAGPQSSLLRCGCQRNADQATLRPTRPTKHSDPFIESKVVTLLFARDMGQCLGISVRSFLDNDVLISVLIDRLLAMFAKDHFRHDSISPFTCSELAGERPTALPGPIADLTT
jgi:hypothetical protein